MEINGIKMKWICRICPDNGRLYNGSWISEKAIPAELWPNTVVFDDFPSNTNGGCDYIWDGEALTYSPEEKPAESEGTT